MSVDQQQLAAFNQRCAVGIVSLSVNQVFAFTEEVECQNARSFFVLGERRIFSWSSNKLHVFTFLNS